MNVDEFAGTPAGTRAVRAPEWTGTVAAYYETALSPDLDLNVNPFVDFSSSQDHQLPSFNAPRRKAYGFVNLRVGRSAERRVGQECVSTCRSRWSPYH